MRALHVLTDTDRRGAQTFGSQLAAYLQGLGVDNRVIALRHGQAGGLDVEALGPARFGPATFRGLRRAMGEVDVTVAHGSTTLPAAALASAGPGRPFVYRQISDPAYWTPTRSKRWRVRLAYRFPNRVVALTARSGRLIEQRFGVAADRITVIPNAVDASGFDSSLSAAAAREHFGVGGDTRPVVLYVGSLAEEKGALDLLSAPIASPHRVLFAGDGPLRARLETASRSEDRVVVLGVQADMAAVYAAADVVVLPSWSEELPAVLIEAGLAGLPVVATSVGSVPDIVENGVSGVLVPARNTAMLAEAIDGLLASRERRVAMGEAGRARVGGRFTFEAVIDRWAELLEEVASAP